MDDVKSTGETGIANAAQTKRRGTSDLPPWETPKLEDVSEQVMAQPYIRFT